MKTKPILFSTEMVLANLNGRKSQTRRIVNPQPGKGFVAPADDFKKGYWCSKRMIEMLPSRFEITKLFKPKYQVGDILWVRETWAKSETGFVYKASICGNNEPENGWKPSIFMPKDAARIFLEVICVECEKLQSITEKDAIGEGIEPNPVFSNKGYRDYFYSNEPFPTSGHHCMYAYDSFMTLWKKLHGFESWEINPYVWVYRYRVIEKPENF